MSIVTGNHLILPKGTKIRNVKGSADDKPYEWTGDRYQPSIYRNWIDIWKHQSHNNNRNIKCCACNKYPAVLGAHIVLGDGTQAGDAANNILSKKSNRVFIVPFCNECNQKRDVLETKRDVYALHIFYYNINIDDPRYCGKIYRTKLKATDKQIFRGIDQYDKNYLNKRSNSGHSLPSTVSRPSHSHAVTRAHDLSSAKKRSYSNRKAKSFR